MDEPIVLYEDNHLVVVVKPQNMPTMADSSGDPDLLGWVKNYVKVKYEKPGDAFIGLVHRLDRPTGGVMVFARTSKAAARLSEQIREGETEKRYLAVTIRIPRERRARLTNELIKDTDTNTVRISVVPTPESKEAILDYRVLETVDNKYALVDIELITGRGHQARVQMKGIGCPIFGDARYGGGTAKDGNHALWAYELKFKHPTSGKTMAFKVFPPTENSPWKYFSVEKYINVSRPND